MARPTMDEMRERVVAVEESEQRKPWDVDVEIEVTFRRTVHVEAPDDDAAREKAVWEAQCGAVDRWDDEELCRAVSVVGEPQQAKEVRE